MNLWNFFSKYPASIITYIVYVWLFILSLVKEREYHLLEQQNQGVWHHGVREDGLLIPLFSGIFFLACCGNAIVAKENKFYLWLIVLILVPLLTWPQLLAMMNFG